MNSNYFSNSTEQLKREWLIQLMAENSDLDLSYFAMLSDKEINSREEVINNFEEDMEERLGKKIYLYNAINEFTKKERYFYTNDFLRGYRERGQKDELIFADPDTGFYSTNVSSVKDKRHIDMKMIEELLKNTSSNTIIACFQYNQNNSYTGGIQEQIEDYIVSYLPNVTFNYTTYVSAKPQLKLYIFKK